MSTSETPSPGEAVSGVQFSANAVLDRMREAWKVETDSALADRLHTARQSISKWRSRNSVPYAEAIFTSNIRQVSLDWLLKGQGDIGAKSPPAPDVLDFELIRASLLSLIGFGILRLRDESEANKFLDDITTCAKAIARGYAKATKTIELLCQENHMTLEEARRVAISAAELVSSGGDLYGPRSTPGTVSKRRRTDGAQ